MLFGNDNILKMIESMSQGENIAHAYLFVGPEGVGKTTFAKHFAQKLLCDDKCGCGKCTQCKIFEVGNHPDFQILDDSEKVTVDQSRELIKFLDLKPYQAKRKVSIIANAERMTTSAANSLLKTLEEPAGETVIILTTTNADILLPTIKSRTQIVKFSNLSTVDFEKFKNENIDHKNFEAVSRLANGRIALAKKLLDDEEQFLTFMEIVYEFEKVASDAKLFPKIKFAEKVAKGKYDLGELLSVLEGYYREKLVDEKTVDQLKISLFLDKLTETKELLKRNVNKQLAFESLLFVGV